MPEAVRSSIGESEDMFREVRPQAERAARESKEVVANLVTPTTAELSRAEAEVGMQGWRPIREMVSPSCLFLALTDCSTSGIANQFNLFRTILSAVIA